MKANKAGAIVGLVFVSLLTFTAVHSYRGSERRAALALSWSNDEFNFTATGDDRATFTVEPLTNRNQQQLSCSLFIGLVVTDSKLYRELKDAGFSSISCGPAKIDLP